MEATENMPSKKGSYWFQSWRESSSFLILVVAIALFLDNLLLTIIVPIIPEYLYEKRLAENESLTISTANVSAFKDNVRKHQNLMEETSEIGFMLGSKAIVQLVSNLMVGPLTIRFGYSCPMLFGFFIMFVSTLIFAFGNSYKVLFFARAVQGIGSACVSVAGMGLIADRFSDDNERGSKMALSLSGIALGVIVGPPLGGVLYYFFGKTIPFLIVCGMIVFGAYLKSLTISPASKDFKKDVKSPSLKALFMDPYILLASGGMCIGNIGFAFLDTSLAVYMIDTMDSESWELGVVFLPCSILYWITLGWAPKLNEKIGRWAVSILGLFFTGASLLFVPLARNVIQLSIPIGVTGIAIAMVECALLPELAHLVDIRHSSVYGNVYAVGDFALCLGFGIGPIFCGVMIKQIGFIWLTTAAAVICFAFTPLLYLLKNPPSKKVTTDPADKKLISIELKNLSPAEIKP